MRIGLPSCLAVIAGVSCLLQTAHAITTPCAAADTAAYPSRAITLVVALAAGGAADIIARGVAQRMQEDWGQPVLVENKGGANTQLAAAQIAHADADGYTLLVTPEHTFTVNPFLYSKLPYDAERDFVPVSGLVDVAQALVADPKLPVRSISELVALARTQPLSYGSVGVGSSQHLGMMALQATAGMRLEPVQYRGAARR